MKKVVTGVKDLGNPLTDEGPELYSVDTKLELPEGPELYSLDDKMVLPEEAVKYVFSANDIGKEQYEKFLKDHLVDCDKDFMIQFPRKI